jgi:hypothetical protein
MARPMAIRPRPQKSQGINGPALPAGRSDRSGFHLGPHGIRASQQLSHLEEN